MNQTTSSSSSDNSDPQTRDSEFGLRPLRIWPPILLILAIPILRGLPLWIENGPANLWMSAAFGPLLCALLILLWWAFISRASLQEKLVGFFGCVLAATAIGFLVHHTMLGPALIVLTIPMGMVAFAIGAILFGSQPFRRTIIALLLATIAFGFSLLLRNEGMWGDFKPELLWRWTPSAEERMLAEKSEAAPVADDVVQTLMQQVADDDFVAPEWPAFRGGDRLGSAKGVQIEPWAQPPRQLWKRLVGPAWSSFVVAGKLIFTQEQRDQDEVVVCYSADSGEEIWSKSVQSRFYDALGGAGPRATPTIADGSVFALGAKGDLLRLDPRSGDVLWQKDLKEAANCKPPTWGFSSSPLIADGKVIVHAGGKDLAAGGMVVAFSIENGEVAWTADTGHHSYSSPQLCNLAGENVLVMLTNLGMTALDPATGDERLDYEWTGAQYRALQAAIIDGESLLIPSGDGLGTRRVAITIDAGELDAEQVWSSRSMTPDFNDLVVHKGYAYGFDGSSAILTCIDLENGKRKWRTRENYGKGQMLLIPDSDLLLIASEFGDVALVRALPDGYEQVAKFKALEGKTWNHPVVVGNRLYIRNAQEAACFEW